MFVNTLSVFSNCIINKCLLLTKWATFVFATIKFYITIFTYKIFCVRITTHPQQWFIATISVTNTTIAVSMSIGDIKICGNNIVRCLKQLL